MATHSSILAWKIPWTEEPGGLQFMGLQRIGHDLVAERVHSPATGRRLLDPIHHTLCSPYQVLELLSLPKVASKGD